MSWTTISPGVTIDASDWSGLRDEAGGAALNLRGAAKPPRAFLWRSPQSVEVELCNGLVRTDERTPQALNITTAYHATLSSFR